MEQEELLNSIWETIALPEKINEPKSCCNNQQRYDNDEYIICVNCGIILEQIINENKESSYANNNDGEKGKNNERCGASTNPLIPSISMNSTVIAGNSNLSRIQNWLNNDSISYSEKVLMKYKYRIGELVNLYNISGDISTAILYKIKELIEMKEKLGIIHRGKNYSGLIGACFYYS
jgi:transcription initiation factor TFIIIB Brf1 subunit/transcription initiation factor TFIIB